MSTQGGVRNSHSAPSIFFKHKTTDKNTSKPTKREDSESQVLIVNTGTSSLLSQEMLQIPTSDFRCKEKIPLKLNSLNGKKARYETHKTFLSKCHCDKKFHMDYQFMWNLQLVTQMKHFLKPGMKTSNCFFLC